MDGTRKRQMSEAREHLRFLPGVDQVLRWPELAKWEVVRPVRIQVIQQVLQELRKNMPSHSPSTGEGEIRDRLRQEIVERILARSPLPCVPCINASGILLHTNLGRAPLAPRVVRKLQEVLGHYTNLEFHRPTGERGDRLAYVRSLLCSLLACEEALVVNNNAGALFLAVRTFVAHAKGTEVIISRGELVEIGDSFRIPEIIESAGAKLCEVGTTNRTYVSDYERAINEQTALILQVHPSNFAQRGFCCTVPMEDLAALGKRRHVPVMADVGSGLFYGDANLSFLEREPKVKETLRCGITALCCSGDKLLGGPQAGILAGERLWLEKMRKDPLYRALRLSKIDLVALEKTLEIYADGNIAELPVWRQIEIKEDVLRERAQGMVKNLRRLGFTAREERAFSQVGGGSLPGVGLPTWIVRIPVQRFVPDIENFARRLRMGNPAIVVRLEEGEVICDVRTLLDENEVAILERGLCSVAEALVIQKQEGMVS